MRKLPIFAAALVLVPLTLRVSGWPTLAIAVPPTAAPPVTIDVGSDGSDGAFAPASNIEIDLATSGHYDLTNWVVVFNYTSVNIPAGVTVTFHNHPSRAPVAWLVQGSVTIDGTVELNGREGTGWLYTVFGFTEPGPGGFRGGTNSPGSPGPAPSAGFGPGAGMVQNHGSFGGGPSPYGSPTLLQLIGGSGGGAGNSGIGGGGGGGAILIAANSTITISSSGYISARGGPGIFSGSGAGGAVRLLADQVSVEPGRIDVSSPAYQGRIRIEANSTGSIITSPPASIGFPGPVFPPPGSPTLRVASIGAINTPADPRAGLGNGGAPDISLPQPGLTTVVIVAENVPLASTVFLRVGQAHGDSTLLQVVNPLVGTLAYSTTSIDVDLSAGATALQARAVFP